MQLPFDSLLKTLYREVFLHRNIVFIIFSLISLSMLAVGSIWPKHYTSSAVIIADDSNILQPLMQGTAETTHVTNHVANAREILFGEIIMSQIIKDAGLLDHSPTEFEQAHIKEDIKNQVKVSGIGRNLIKIEAKNNDPEKAYIIAKRMSELFIEEGEKSKIDESQAAFDFIQKQVKQYLDKLTEVEKQLEEFRKKNPDARPGTDTVVSERISRLTNDIERTRLELREARIRQESLEKQLSGEAAITISMSKEGQYRSKIAELQSRLETLRLDYNETYPDIVRINHQIMDLKSAMNAEIEQRKIDKLEAQNEGETYVDESISVNPLYQQLRSEASTNQTHIATLETRINEMNKMLESAYDRAKRIHGGEAELSKLTRDYQVNQDIYQDLLRRMERARVSKSLDEENQGLTYKIQEPAKLPLIPIGLRFIHFAAAGILMGMLVPLGLIYILIQFDPRVRYTQIINDELNIPVLAETYKILTTDDVRKIKYNLYLLVAGVMIIACIYGYVGWLKFIGAL